MERENKNGYRHLRQALRMAFNETFSKEKEQLNIDTLEFVNANIYHLTQTLNEPITICGKLDINRLNLKIIQKLSNENFNIEISKLTGQMKIFLINNAKEYSIEMKFDGISIDDSNLFHENLTNDEKVIFHLLKQTIEKTIVHYCFYTSDISSDLSQKESISSPTIQTSTISQQTENILKPTTNENVSEILPKIDEKKILIRIVKAVKLHDVEQPFCILQLNRPKQIYQTTIAKNGLNPFWDERFLFECNEKSNQLRLQIIDRKKANKKRQTNNETIDVTYADVLIPFSYLSNTIYKQDVQITPQYPDSIIRIEFSTFFEKHSEDEENLNEIESLNDTQNWSNNQFESLPSNENFPSTNLNNTNENVRLNKPKKSRSFMSSLRHLKISRRKKANKNGQISSFDEPTQSSVLTNETSTDSQIPTEMSDPTAIHRRRTIAQSLRNLFRSNSKKKISNKKILTSTDNFIIDQSDIPSTSTITPKKPSFLRRFKTKTKQSVDLSTNSLTSYDRTRSESVRNTPIRANVGHPVTMTRANVK